MEFWKSWFNFKHVKFLLKLIIINEPAPLDETAALESLWIAFARYYQTSFCESMKNPNSCGKKLHKNDIYCSICGARRIQNYQKEAMTYGSNLSEEEAIRYYFDVGYSYNSITIFL